MIIKGVIIIFWLLLVERYKQRQRGEKEKCGLVGVAIDLTVLYSSDYCLTTCIHTLYRLTVMASVQAL